MNSSSGRDPGGAGSSNLKGLRILLAEDSWHVAQAMAKLLRALGADLAGPVASQAEAERLVSERLPDVALIDFNLRGGERAFDLIDRMNDQGVRVIVISGHEDVPLAPGKAIATLQKPIDMEKLLAALRLAAAHRGGSAAAARS